MTNARDELIEATKTHDILCARISKDEWWGEVGEEYILTVGYSEEEKRAFFNALNFEYDAGYGSQNLYGNVWLKDGTWLERGEYDGSEWWEYKECPRIPKDCKGKG
jgi:hypothetical protein